MEEHQTHQEMLVVVAVQAHLVTQELAAVRVLVVLVLRQAQALEVTFTLVEVVVEEVIPAQVQAVLAVVVLAVFWRERLEPLTRAVEVAALKLTVLLATAALAS